MTKTSLTAIYPGEHLTLLHAWALNDDEAAELINAWPVNELATHYVAIWAELHAEPARLVVVTHRDIV
jgi:hypothetical protein